MALPDLPTLGQNPWYTPRTNWDNAVKAELEGRLSEETLTQQFAAFEMATAYGAVGDGVTDNSTALANGLIAAQGRALYLPAGEYIVNSATRLALTGNFSSIVGDPSGAGTIIRFTNASGGLDIGDGVTNVYENRLSNVLISGNSVATTVVRCRKVYEPYFENVRIEGSSSAAGSTLVLMNESGQLDADRIVLANAPIGIRLTGTIDPIANIRLGNFYNLGECIRWESSSASKFALSDSWIEACTDVFTVNRPGASFSIGEVLMSDVRVLKAAGNQYLFRVIAVSSINSQVLDFEQCYVDAQASTTPLFDLTVAPTGGTVRISGRRNTVLYANVGTMLQANAGQAWNTLLADFREINGVSPALWYPTPLTLSYPTPPVLSGAGVPAVAAPRGSLYQRNDAFPGFYPGVYTKLTDGDTTWHAVGTQKVLYVKTTSYAITLADEVVVANGASVTITLPAAGLWHGRFWTVKNINAASATVASSGGTIDGATTKSLAQWQAATFISDGSNWLTI